MNALPPPFEDVDLTTPVTERRPGTMVGRTVFRGTRVPVEVLFENLADGVALDEIVASYPTLDLRDCRTALLQACALMTASHA